MNQNNIINCFHCQIIKLLIVFKLGEETWLTFSKSCWMSKNAWTILTNYVFLFSKKKIKNLNIQTFHQCLIYHSISVLSTLILVKLNMTNFLLLSNQIIFSIHGIKVLHHLLNREKPTKEIKNDKGSKSDVLQYRLWINNDRFITFWVHRTMKEDFFLIWSLVLTLYMRYELLLKSNCFLLWLKKKN